MKKYIRKHGEKVFHHSVELLSALRNGSCKLTIRPKLFERGTLISELLATYRIRAELIKDGNTGEDELLYSDIIRFCENMELSKDKNSISWHFDFTNGDAMIVFEGVPSQKILGCLKTYEVAKE